MKVPSVDRGDDIRQHLHDRLLVHHVVGDMACVDMDNPPRHRSNDGTMGKPHLDGGQDSSQASGSWPREGLGTEGSAFSMSKAALPDLIACRCP